MVKSDITQGLHRMRFVMFRCYESKTRARNVSITGSTCQLIDRPWIVINFLPIHLQLSIFFLSFFVRLNISLKCWPLTISPKCIWIYWARDSGSSRCRLEVQKTLRRVHLTNLQSRFFSPLGIQASGNLNISLHQVWLQEQRLQGYANYFWHFCTIGQEN